MLRILLFIAIITIGAVGATWIADRPGDIVVTWQGYRIETSVAVGAIGLLVAAAVLAILWSIFATIVRLPSIVALASRQRRRAKGYTAVSRGMVAIGAGDSNAARRFAGEAERLLGKAPLALLLKAQSAQIRGDRSGAENAFKDMLEDDETRVLGLRGLYIEARRRGDDAAAESYAAEAMRLAPTAGWASEAVLERQCAEEDWAGARLTLDRRVALRLVAKDDGRHARAALLAAEALGKAERSPDEALALAMDALKLSPGLAPAAALAGRLKARKGDLKKAAKVIEQAWRQAPQPDLAETYISLRPGDSTHDRLDRAKRLAKLDTHGDEGRLALAQAALDAREFKLAREALAPVLAGEPTARAYLIAAEIEEVEFGAAGKVREWLARAARAPRDPAWVADGIASDIWRPVSPSGAMGTYRWMRPPERLATPHPHDGADAILLDHDERSTELVHPAGPEPAAGPAPAAPPNQIKAAPAGTVPVAAEAPKAQPPGSAAPADLPPAHSTAAYPAPTFAAHPAATVIAAPMVLATTPPANHLDRAPIPDDPGPDGDPLEPLRASGAPRVYSSAG